jgi:hypothetical protein
MRALTVAPFLLLVFLAVVTGLERMHGGVPGVSLPSGPSAGEVERHVKAHAGSQKKPQQPVSTAKYNMREPEAPPMPPALPHSTDLIEHFHKVVRKIDTNEDGVLNKDEFLRYLHLSVQLMGGPAPTTEFLSNEYTSLLVDSDSDSNGVLEVDEFWQAADTGRISGYLSHIIVHQELQTQRIEL